MARLINSENVYITNNKDVEMELLENGIVTISKWTIFRVDAYFEEYMRVAIIDNYGDRQFGYINYMDGVYNFV